MSFHMVHNSSSTGMRLFISIYNPYKTFIIHHSVLNQNLKHFTIHFPKNPTPSTSVKMSQPLNYHLFFRRPIPSQPLFLQSEMLFGCFLGPLLLGHGPATVERSFFFQLPGRSRAKGQRSRWVAKGKHRKKT